MRATIPSSERCFYTVMYIEGKVNPVCWQSCHKGKHSSLYIWKEFLSGRKKRGPRYSSYFLVNVCSASGIKIEIEFSESLETRITSIRKTEAFGFVLRVELV